MKDTIIKMVPAECPWRDTLHWYSVTESTNKLAKQAAAEGAPHGTIFLAGQQTNGRGRMGRSFYSANSEGLYISILLRPNCLPSNLMHLTCAAAVATCNAVKSTTGFDPKIKWINDLIGVDKKLGGILTELVIDPKSGIATAAIIGIGINCGHHRDSFPPELRNIATSLRIVTGQPASIPKLASAIIQAFWEMDAHLITQRREIMDAYRRRCITLGKAIVIIQNGVHRAATALSLDDDGQLTVRLNDGSIETVNSGEVSIRGISGYS